MAQEKPLEHTFLHITVLIADRPYQVRVKAGEEAMIYRIAKEISDRIADLEKNPALRDKQDCMALALMTYAVSLERKSREEQPGETPAL